MCPILHVHRQVLNEVSKIGVKYNAINHPRILQSRYEIQ